VDGTFRPRAADNPTLRRLATARLSQAEMAAIRALLWTAFGDDEEEAFREEDWSHSIGGVHFVLERAGGVVGHASVVEREIHVGGMPLRTGYVEAVATAPEVQGTGLGSRVMEAVNAHIRERFELGALGTGRHSFYERLGWLTWRGPSFVRMPEGDLPTPDDDGFILVLPTPASPALDLSAPISCDRRPGDAW